MKIRLFTICKNEEKIMPFFINHYKSWVDEIIIQDGHSADKSIEIALREGDGKVRIVNHTADDGEFLDDAQLKIYRNTGWLDGCKDFDWIISVDNDEFLYHKDIIQKLEKYKNEGVTMPTIMGYNMVSLNFPVENIPITQQIKRGFYRDSYSKQVIFNPKEITPNWGGGNHTCKPVGKLVRSFDDPIFLLHYRWLSYEYYVEKAKYSKSRFSNAQTLRGNGAHIVKAASDSFSYNDYKESFLKTKQIIP